MKKIITPRPRWTFFFSARQNLMGPKCHQNILMVKKSTSIKYCLSVFWSYLYFIRVATISPFPLDICGTYFRFIRWLKITKKTSVAKKKTKPYLAPSKNVENMVILYTNRKLTMSWSLFEIELGSKNVLESSYWRKTTTFIW